MYKIILTISLIFFISANAQEPIQLSAKYNEASARIEAFKNVKQKIKKEFYSEYLKDKNRKENLEFIEKNIFETNKGRSLCPFYIKDTLASYSVTYDDKIQYNFYYNFLGNLIKFDIVESFDYPRKTLGYSRYGNLISVSFEINDEEQFVYDENGKLLAHWVNDVALNKNNKSPKLIKLKRGTK